MRLEHHLVGGYVRYISPYIYYYYYYYYKKHEFKLLGTIYQPSLGKYNYALWYYIIRVNFPVSTEEY